MKIHYIWRDCTFYGSNYSGEPVDAFWVQCSTEEAMPLLKGQSVGRAYFNDPYNELSGVYFLIAKDLSVIQATPWHYPIDNLWNGDSPFEPIKPIIEVQSLEDIKNITVPIPSGLRDEWLERLQSDIHSTQFTYEYCLRNDPYNVLQDLLLDLRALAKENNLDFDTMLEVNKQMFEIMEQEDEPGNAKVSGN